MDSTPSKPTILLIRNAAASDFGGAETYPVSLSKILEEEGTYRPVIVTSSKKLLTYAKEHGVHTEKGLWLTFQNWTGWRTILIPFYIVWLGILTVWYTLLIWKHRPQALHIQSRDDFIAASIAGRITKTQVVWTDHMDLRYIFMNITRPFRNLAGKIVLWSVRFADHIIIISDNELRLISELLPPSNHLIPKVRLIKNGVTDQLQGIKDKSPLSIRALHPASFHFCLASRLVANKGVGDAIAAYRLMLESIPEEQAAHVYLDIYGSGADEEDFKRQARDLPGVLFHGHTSNPLQVVYQSDVFMLPSYQEGFSIALLEATMLGKAIIASSVDSNPEIITDYKTGLLIPPKNPQRLADAMIYLFKNPLKLKELEKNARINYEENYNLEQITAKAIIPLYGK